MKGKPVSILRIMDDIAQHPMLRELPLETVIRYVLEFMRIVDCSFVYTEKICDIAIEDHRGVLPCDFIQEVQVRGEHGEPYLYATGTFSEVDGNGNQLQPSYSIKGSIIQTSLENGVVQLCYKCIETDEDSYPLIPDDAVTIRAIEAYIKKQWFTILFDMSKLPAQVYNNAQQEYAWAVGQCESRQHYLTLDKMQALTNSLNTLIQRSREHESQFASLGERENIKKH